MRTISITEALRELKLLDSRISKQTRDGKFVGAAKKSSAMIGVQTKEVFEKAAKSAFESITSLIANRNALKSAIVKSNATTIVEVGGKTMTVAEAIERKSSIEYEKLLLSAMKMQYSSATTTMLTENAKVDKQVDKMLETYLGKESDKKIAKEDYDTISQPYRDKNEFALVDPLGIFDRMQAMEDDIAKFDGEVDVRLSICNSTTMIEIDF